MAPRTASDLRRAWTDFFAARQHTIVPSGSLIPTHPSAPMFTNSGMMPFVPYFLGEEPVPYRPAARRVGAALRAGGRQAQRPRRHRAVAPPPQLLRDAGQLQLRRLLQGRGHRLGLGVRHRGARARPRPPVGHRPRERRRGRGPLGRRGRLPPRAHPAAREGQLLGDGRDRSLRAVVRDLLGLRARVRPRGRSGQPRGREPLRRDLEPGVPAVPPGRRRRSSATCPARTSTPAPGSSASWPCWPAAPACTRPTR